MYAALASIALISTAAACKYTERPSAVLNGNAALRIPMLSQGAGAQNECAATAEAFGITSASIGMLLASFRFSYMLPFPLERSLIWGDIEVYYSIGDGIPSTGNRFIETKLRFGTEEECTSLAVTVCSMLGLFARTPCGVT
jgi:hypothetical protein